MNQQKLTIPEKTEQVKKAVRDKLPRLMELREGCEVKVKRYKERPCLFNGAIKGRTHRGAFGYGSGYPRKGHIEYEVAFYGEIEYDKDLARIEPIFDDSIVEIIGHEPNILNVLQALDVVDEYGYTELLHIGGGEGYYLSHDTEGNFHCDFDKKIEEQPPETIEFLHSIFYKKDTKA